MKMASLTDVKNDLSRYVEQVRRGGRVRILVRGVPVADLVPAGSGAPRDASQEDAELADLERRGIVRRGTGAFPRELDGPGPRVKGGDAVATLLDDRRSRG
jgi:prevent-host-death family protein